MHQVSQSGIDPFLSTSVVVHSYLPLSNLWFCWNPKAMLYFELGNLASSIGEEPVPSIRRSATSSLVSFAEQGIITFTNVLQGYNTVVLVCYHWVRTRHHLHLVRKTYQCCKLKGRTLVSYWNILQHSRESLWICSCSAHLHVYLRVEVWHHSSYLLCKW